MWSKDASFSQQVNELLYSTQVKLFANGVVRCSCFKHMHENERTVVQTPKLSFRRRSCHSHRSYKFFSHENKPNHKEKFSNIS